LHFFSEKAVASFFNNISLPLGVKLVLGGELGPSIFSVILFLSATLSTGMTGISLHMQWLAAYSLCPKVRDPSSTQMETNVTDFARRHARRADMHFQEKSSYSFKEILCFRQ
jgi:hypothetical protein